MKLLLVDDEEYVIESIKRNLDLTETRVSEVYTAFSVQQAKNIMGMVDIDIVISDIVMPGGTGFDFVEWVRKEELKVQVIFLTSYAEFDYARRAIQLNSVDYLLKPIDFDKLKEAVQRAAESVAKEKKIQDLRYEADHVFRITLHCDRRADGARGSNLPTPLQHDGRSTPHGGNLHRGSGHVHAGQCIPACKLLYPALRWKNDHHVPVRQRLHLGCQCAGGFLPEPFYRTFDLRNLLYGYVG